MKPILSCVFALVALVALSAPSSAATIEVNGQIRLTSLTDMALDASFAFDGATSQQLRAAADEQGNKNGLVEANESSSFEATFRANLEKSFTEDDDEDDTPPTLDGQAFLDPTRLRSFSLAGLADTPTSSQEPIAVSFGMDSELDGPAPAGNQHTFAMKSDDEDEEEDEDDDVDVEGAIRIQVPDGHEICSLRGAKKVSSTAAEFSTKTASSLFGSGIEIVFVKSGTACPKDDGGFLPAPPWAGLVAVGAALGAVRARRR